MLSYYPRAGRSRDQPWAVRHNAFGVNCWQLPVAVVSYPDLASEETVVLGQAGFLEYFDVRFLGKARTVELKPNASFPKKCRR
jgi:hypothetical protein